MPVLSALEVYVSGDLSSNPCSVPLLLRWMGLTAFIRVLRSKQTRYGQLLAELEELAAAPALRHAAHQLAPVVDPSRSSAFECILY